MSITKRLLRKAKGWTLKRMHRMITCAEFEDFILAYLDGELDSRKKAIFELHLKICRECRNYLEAYRRAIKLGKAVFESPYAPLPRNVPEDLVQAILRARSS